MRGIIATVTISLALPLLDHVTFAQAISRGSAARGTAAIGTTGRATVTSGRTTQTVAPGPALSIPAGSGVVPGSTTTVGPVNAGGITATPPGTVGRTFERGTITDLTAPGTTSLTPSVNESTFGFAPAGTQGGTATTSGLLDSRGPQTTTFPSGDLSQGVTATAGNTVNFGSIVPAEPVSITLPLGARLIRNSEGVSEAVVPAPVPVLTPTTPVITAATPVIVPTPIISPTIPVLAPNSVGRSPAFQSASQSAPPVPQPSTPPRSTPIR
jgi:hypothetical protein